MSLLPFPGSTCYLLCYQAFAIVVLFAMAKNERRMNKSFSMKIHAVFLLLRFSAPVAMPAYFLSHV